jgi:hypothetical protein
MDDRSKLEIWGDAAKRLFMLNTLSNVLPLYIVSEYPKSGGTWISQVLSECMGLPFPRNEAPKFESCLMHGHIKYTPLMSNVVVVYRDGRDCMVSWYFHSLFQNDKNSPILVEKTRKDLEFKDVNNVKENLPKFIEFIFEKDKSSLSPYKFTWAEFVRDGIGRGTAAIKYESMVIDGVDEIQRVLRELGRYDVSRDRIEQVVEKFSFANQAKRKAGEENKSSFLRKGQPGDWKNKFNRNSAEIFDHYAGSELVKLGYEKDSSWVDTL